SPDLADEGVELGGHELPRGAQDHGFMGAQAAFRLAPGWRQIDPLREHRPGAAVARALLQLAQLLAQPELVAVAVVEEGGVAEDQALLVVAADLRLVPLEERQDHFEPLLEEVAFDLPGGREVARLADQIDPADLLLPRRRPLRSRRLRLRREA